MMGEVHKRKYILYTLSFCILCGCCLALAQSEKSESQRKSDAHKWETIALAASITAVITTVCAFISMILLERRKRRKELKNIRSILLEEIRWNCKELMKLTPFSGDRRKRAVREVVGETMSMLSSSVYEKYLDKLCGLKEEEVRSIYALYIWVQYYAEAGRVDVDKAVMTDEHSARYRIDHEILFGFCDRLLHSLFRTMELLEDGTKGLYDLMDKVENEREKGWTFLFPNSPYRQWLNNYANEYHGSSPAAAEKLGNREFGDG